MALQSAISNHRRVWKKTTEIGFVDSVGQALEIGEIGGYAGMNRASGERTRWEPNQGITGCALSNGVAMPPLSLGAERRNFGLHIKLPYQVSMQGDWYIAQCALLKSVGQGRTERTAIKNLTDAIALKIQRGLETGRLSKVLQEYGFYGVRIGDRLCWAHPDERNVGDRILDRSVFLKTLKPEQPAPMGRGLPSDDLRWIIAWQASEPSSGHPRPY